MTATCFAQSQQTNLWVQSGPVSTDYGINLLAGEDLTGDSNFDVLVAAPRTIAASSGCPSGFTIGSVEVLDGLTGAVTSISGLSTEACSMTYGQALGWVNRSRGRIIIGDPLYSPTGSTVDPFGRVFVYDVANGVATQLFSYEGVGSERVVGGGVTSDLGNINGVFENEFAFTIRNAQFPGGFYSIRDGLNFSEIATITPSAGGSVSDLVRLGDLPSQSSGAVLAANVGPGLRLIDFSTGSTIFQHAANGLATAAEDVNGDLEDEYLVAFGATVTFPGGSVSLFDGATHVPLWTVGSSDLGDDIGFSAALVGDINGDGLNDLAVGAPGFALPNSSGYVKLLSLATGTQLAELVPSPSAPTSRVRFGTIVASGGDVDFDGMTDIIVGSPSDASGNPLLMGAVYAVKSELLGPATGATFCDCISPLNAPCMNEAQTLPGGCQNSVGLAARLRGFGNPSETNSLFLVADRLPNNNLMALFSGTGVLQSPVQGPTNGLLCIQANGPRTYADSNTSGVATFGPDLMLPNVMVGGTLYFQGIYRDLGGPCGQPLNYTNATAILVQ